MADDRWEQIQTLYHRARELNSGERAAFLAQACAQDDALRVEVEAVLAADEQAGGFLETPALKVSGLIGSQLSRGTLLGPYEILAPIGAGGMGEVYRGRDTKLKRDVAIKVLPEEFSRDRDRITRFQREAEVLASLDYVSYCTPVNEVC